MRKYSSEAAFTLAELIIVIGLIGVLAVTMLSLNKIDSPRVNQVRLHETESALRSWGIAITRANETGLGAATQIRSQADLEHSITYYFLNNGFTPNKDLVTDDYTGEGKSTIISLGKHVYLNVAFTNAGGDFTSSSGLVHASKDEFNSPLAAIRLTGEITANKTENIDNVLFPTGLTTLDEQYLSYTKYNNKTQKVIDRDGNELDIEIACLADDNICFEVPPEHCNNTYIDVISNTPCPGTHQTGSIQRQYMGTCAAKYIASVDMCCDEPLVYSMASGVKCVCPPANKIDIPDGYHYDSTNRVTCYTANILDAPLASGCSTACTGNHVQNPDCSCSCRPKDELTFADNEYYDTSAEYCKSTCSGTSVADSSHTACVGRLLHQSLQMSASCSLKCGINTIADTGACVCKCKSGYTGNPDKGCCIEGQIFDGSSCQNLSADKNMAVAPAEETEKSTEYNIVAREEKQAFVKKQSFSRQYMAYSAPKEHNDCNPSEDNTIAISTPKQLLLVGSNMTVDGITYADNASYCQMADIDLSGYSQEYKCDENGQNCIEWNLLPEFTGTYNRNSYTIHYAHVEDSENNSDNSVSDENNPSKWDLILDRLDEGVEDFEAHPIDILSIAYDTVKDIFNIIIS